MTKAKSKPQAPARNPQRKVRSAPASPAARREVGCLECALCCSYVAIEINPPNTLKRATELLWYLYHENVSLYEDAGEWMIQFQTRCRNLGEDRRCGVYATRPHICREYSEKECEVNSEDRGRSFYTADEFIQYLHAKRPRLYAKLAQGFLPPKASLEAKTPRRLPLFERRVKELRALGTR